MSARSSDPIGNLKAMIMPAFVLGTGVPAVLMRHTRSAMLEVLGSDYVRTARAKGLSRRVSCWAMPSATPCCRW